MAPAVRDRPVKKIALILVLAHGAAAGVFVVFSFAWRGACCLRVGQPNASLVVLPFAATLFGG